MKHKLLVFVLINLAIAALAAMAPKPLIGGGEYERQRVVFDFVERVQPGQHLDVILGDSRSECCLSAAEMGFVNLSLAGGSPVEGYYLLRRLIERGAHIDRLIISFGAFHVFSQDTYYSRSRYYGLIPDEFIGEVHRRIIELDDAEYRKYGWKALETIDASMPFLPERAKFAIVNTLSIDSTLEATIRGLRRGLRDAGRREIADPRFKLHEVATAGFVNAAPASPESEKPDARSPVNEYYLARLAELARSHRIALHYLAMPMNAGVRQPPEAYFQRFAGIVERSGFAGCFSGVRFWPNALYWDAAHLNETGAARLNQELATGVRYCQPAG
ncbi:MAG: hypothetical protein U1F30_16235 [Steroidobacteraceae bacterium]